MGERQWAYGDVMENMTLPLNPLPLALNPPHMLVNAGAARCHGGAAVGLRRRDGEHDPAPESTAPGPESTPYAGECRSGAVPWGSGSGPTAT
jgi:hypothetical protein